MKPQLQSSFSKLPDHKFIKTNSLVAITIYFIISSIFLTYGIITSSTSFLLSVSVVFTGIFFFTFIEYIFHRFVYHSGKDYMDEKNWQFKVHGIHHAFPKNKNIVLSENIVLPKEITLVIKEDQKIILSHGSSLVLLGNIDIKGTKEKQSIIEGVQPNYGSIISVNNIFKAKKFLSFN